MLFALCFHFVSFTNPSSKIQLTMQRWLKQSRPLEDLGRQVEGGSLELSNINPEDLIDLIEKSSNDYERSIGWTLLICLGRFDLAYATLRQLDKVKNKLPSKSSLY